MEVLASSMQLGDVLKPASLRIASDSSQTCSKQGRFLHRCGLAASSLYAHGAWSPEYLEPTLGFNVLLASLLLAPRVADRQSEEQRKQYYKTDVWVTGQKGLKGTQEWPMAFCKELRLLLCCHLSSLSWRRLRLLQPNTYSQASQVLIARCFATYRWRFNSFGSRQVCMCSTAGVFGFAQAAATQELAALIAGSVDSEPESTEQGSDDEGAEAAALEQQLFGDSSDDSNGLDEHFDEATDLAAGSRSEPGSPTVECNSDSGERDATLAEGQAYASTPVAAFSAASSSDGPRSPFDDCSISGSIASAFNRRCARRSSSLASSSGWSTSRAATAANAGAGPKHGARWSATLAGASAAAGTAAADDTLCDDYVATSEPGEDCDADSQVSKAVPNVLFPRLHHGYAWLPLIAVLYPGGPPCQLRTTRGNHFVIPYSDI